MSEPTVSVPDFERVELGRAGRRHGAAPAAVVVIVVAAGDEGRSQKQEQHTDPEQ